MLLRPSEAEKFFRLTRPTLERWVAEGKLTAYRTTGGHRRYSAREIEALLREHGQKEAEGGENE